MIDYGLITSITAIVAAIVAIYAIWSENRRSNLALGVDLMMKLDDRFFGVEFKRKRQQAATMLLEENPDYENAHTEELDDVLDFFELLAMLGAKRAVDKQLVWANFFYWIDHYMAASRDYIAHSRRAMPLVWSDVDQLHTDLRKVHEKHSGVYSFPTSDAIKDFLKYESNLQLS